MSRFNAADTRTDQLEQRVAVPQVRSLVREDSGTLVVIKRRQHPRRNNDGTTRRETGNPRTRAASRLR